MEKMMQVLRSDWHVMRVLRLGAGLFIVFQAWQEDTALVGLLGALFIFQALANVGCCGSGGCAVAPSPTSEK